MSSHVKVLHMRKSSAGRVDVLGQLIYNSSGLFKSCKELNRMLSLPHMLMHPAKAGGLAIYATSGLCCPVFAPSWSRKFLTLQSPLPSLHVKTSHFSQLVGPSWHHLGSLIEPPSPSCCWIMSPRLFLCVWSHVLAHLA